MIENQYLFSAESDTVIIPALASNGAAFDPQGIEI